MAQRAQADRQGSILDLAGQRIGLKGRKAPALVLAAAGLVCLAVFLAVHLSQPALTIERPAEEAEAGAATDASTSDSSTSEGSEDEAAPVLVDVGGAVAEPGVYDIAGTTLRVKDAVEAAGGLSEDADTSAVNLAATVEDGSKVYIPQQGDESASDAAASSAASASSGSAAAASADTGTAATALVNINTATAEELQTLPGVGESTAQAIIQDRTENGSFTSKEDLMRVSGIGEKKYAKLEASICV